MTEPKYKNEEWLRQQYRQESKSVKDIAEDCDVSGGTIRYWRDKFGIDRLWEDKDHLRELYHEEGLSTKKVAERCGCDQSQIVKKLDEFGIGTRSKGKYSPNEENARQYADSEWLEQKWNEERLSQTEIADLCGVDQTTISNWIDKHGIERPWKNHDRLYELYWNEMKSIIEIAEQMNCSNSTIHNELEAADISIRKGGRLPYATYTMDKRGYMVWKARDGDNGPVEFPVHRLLAIAEFDIDEVKGRIIHHENEVKWDNRTENIEPMTRSEHLSHHNIEGTTSDPSRDSEEVTRIEVKIT